MGATVIGNTIYISKDLDKQLTIGERRVVWAHELGHYLEAHRFILLLAVIFLFPFRNIIAHIKRFLEIRADRFALRTTKDYQSFISLMDKLQHTDNSHPTKQERVKLATTMRGNQ